MAAEQEQGERVVVLARVLARRRLRALVAGRHRPAASSRRRRAMLAAGLVDEPPRRDGHEPRLRVHRDALHRPLTGRREQRLLHGVLAGVERRRMPPGDHAEHPRRELAQQGLDARHISIPPGSMTGRTSIGANRALGQPAAISTARSIESHSTMR